jgi:hypothetical protein
MSWKGFGNALEEIWKGVAAGDAITIPGRLDIAWTTEKPTLRRLSEKLFQAHFLNGHYD